MDNVKLIERIVRARLSLEALLPAKQPHNDRCIVEYDLESYAPCDCGASEANYGPITVPRETLQAIIRGLQL